MAKKPAKKLSLSPGRRAGCQNVNLKKPGSTIATSIGQVCAVEGGYEYYAYPGLDVRRGPVKRKATAIHKVVNDYRSWIGWYAVDYHGLGPGYLGKAKRRRR